jgi:hypothetical protein
LWAAVVDGRPVPRFSKIKLDDAKRLHCQKTTFDTTKIGTRGIFRNGLINPAVTGPVWDRLRYLQEVPARSRSGHKTDTVGTKVSKRLGNI